MQKCRGQGLAQSLDRGHCLLDDSFLSVSVNWRDTAWKAPVRQTAIIPPLYVRVTGMLKVQNDSLG